MNIQTQLIRIAKELKAEYMNDHSTFWYNVYFASLIDKQDEDKSVDMSVFKSKTDAFFFTLEHSLKDAAAGYGVKIVLIEKKIFNPKRFWVKVVGMKNGKTVQCDINFERDKVFVDGWYRYNEDKMIKTVADVALDVMTQ